MSNIPASNRKIFAISFIVAILAIVSFVYYVRYSDKLGGVDPNVLAENPNPNIVFDAPFAKANLYYIDLGKFQDNTDSLEVVGCGDGLLPYEIEVGDANGATKSDALSFVLNKLFSNGNFDQLKKDNASSSKYADTNPYNSLSKSKLKLASVKEVPGNYEVYLSGTLSLSGECDDPRAEAQIAETITQIFAPSDVKIFLNNKSLSDAFSLK